MARIRWSLVMVLIAVPAFAAEFQLSSPAIKDKSTITNEQVFNGFGCTGANISPELNWANAPKDTKSFAVTVGDYCHVGCPAFFFGRSRERVEEI